MSREEERSVDVECGCGNMPSQLERYVRMQFSAKIAKTLIDGTDAAAQKVTFHNPPNNFSV